LIFYLNKKKDLEKLISSEMSSSINSSSTNESYFGYSNPKNQQERAKYRSSSSSPKRTGSSSARPKKVTFPDESRLEEPDVSGLDESFVSVTTTTSSIIDNKVIKRKVIR
jgi:hypothetical protein